MKHNVPSKKCSRSIKLQNNHPCTAFQYFSKIILYIYIITHVLDWIWALLTLNFFLTFLCFASLLVIINAIKGQIFSNFNVKRSSPVECCHHHHASLWVSCSLGDKISNFLHQTYVFTKKVLPCSYQTITVSHMVWVDLDWLGCFT